VVEIQPWMEQGAVDAATPDPAATDTPAESTSLAE
jgi:hypothetical protein